MDSGFLQESCQSSENKIYTRLKNRTPSCGLKVCWAQPATATSRHRLRERRLAITTWSPRVSKLWETKRSVTHVFPTLAHIFSLLVHLLTTFGKYLSAGRRQQILTSRVAASRRFFKSNQKAVSRACPLHDKHLGTNRQRKLGTQCISDGR